MDRQEFEKKLTQLFKPKKFFKPTTFALAAILLGTTGVATYYSVCNYRTISRIARGQIRVETVECAKKQEAREQALQKQSQWSGANPLFGH